MTTGVISGVSVSYRWASIDEIEHACKTDERTAVSSLLARDGIDEAFALQTCNRAEAYVVADDAATGRRALADFAPDVRDGAVVAFDHEEGIRHLMRVAAGLESLVLGEDQILGQLKRSTEEARAVEGIGPMLEDALSKAIHVGERARTETKINEGVLSLGNAAVELAETELDLTDATALVVGAGEMGNLATRALERTSIGRVVIANRTVPHAAHVASEADVDASAIGLNALPAAVAAADLVMTATSNDGFVLDYDDLADAGETVLIDLAQPRDIAPDVAALDGVTVYDIDALEAVTDETRDQRQEEAERVVAMIDDEFDRLLDGYKRKRADDAISAMYEGAERVKEREVATALSKLDAQGELTDEQRETVAAMADALVGQLLSAPTKSLREAAAEDDWSTIQTAMQLFDPDFDGQSSSLPEDASDDVPARVLEQVSDD